MAQLPNELMLIIFDKVFGTKIAGLEDNFMLEISIEHS